MQAVLILAHKDISQVKRLAYKLKRKFDVYIHLDKKMSLLSNDKDEMEDKGIHIYQKINVNWGGWGIAAATQFLMREALKNDENTYFHVISAQCYPAQKIEDIYDFYENSNSIYMLASPVAGSKKSGEPLILWQKYYYNYDKVNRRTIFGKIYHRCNILIQTLLGVDKLKKLQIKIPLYEGPNWMDIPRDAVEYILNYFDQNKNIQKLFTTGFCPDEFWVQTILCNSEFEKRIVQNYHRYIKWEHRYGSYPAILDETDFKDIVAGDYHFFRKVDIEHSEQLKNLIDDRYEFNRK